MAIAFVQQTNASGTATNLVLTRPTGTSSGDLLIATCELFDGSTVIDSIAGTGWTLLDKVKNTASGNAHSMATLWRLDNGSGTYTLTWDGSSQFRTGQILAYSGAGSIDVHSLTAQTSSTTVFRGTTVTTTKANAMLVMIGAHANVGNATPPSGMTERVDANRQYSADVIQAVAGSTGNKDATLAGADPSIAGIIALAPSATPADLGTLSSAGVSTTVLSLTATTQVPLGTAAAQSSSTLALTASTKVTLATSAATSTTALTVGVPVPVPLGTSAGLATTSLSLTAKTTVALGSAAGQSTTTLALTAQTKMTLSASTAQSAASLSLSAQTAIVLSNSSALSTSTLVLRATTQIVLSSSTGLSSATLIVSVPGIPSPVTPVPLGGYVLSETVTNGIELSGAITDGAPVELLLGGTVTQIVVGGDPVEFAHGGRPAQYSLNGEVVEPITGGDDDPD